MLFLSSLFLGLATAQTTTFFAPGIPTATAIPGDYTGPYRPQVHFSPPQNFMNDPNGLHRDPSGLWHLYYQLNPIDPVAGEQHWGHATSEDLYHWENQKIALWPFNSTTYVFSGSAVVDPNNTSGFFPDQDNGVVAIYTISADGGLQTQNIAYSRDGGYTFETYADNPVIDVGSAQFRDPQVVWHAATENWVMAVAYAMDFTIEFYTSPDLIDWTPQSNFSHHGLLGLQYECPNLVEMPIEGSDETMSLLYISINPGAPLGGSIGQYFPGTFNGTHFEAIDAAFRIADFGKDNYATQFFSGVDDNAISIAWASNWQYTSVVPTGESEGWRSQMSVPRRNFLREVPRLGYVMVSEPYNIPSVIASELAYRDNLANETLLLDYADTPSGALYFEANITSLTAETLTGTLNFTFTSSQTGEFVAGGTFIGAATWIDRGHTTAFQNPYFTDKFSSTGTFDPARGTWRLSGIIDRSILEVFVNGGEQSATNTFYPTRPLDTLRIAAEGVAEGAQVAVGVWALEDAWAMQAVGNGNGTVLGNTTVAAMGNNGTMMGAGNNMTMSL